MNVMDGSNEETAKRSTHDETFAKIHHRLVLYVKEKEQIDELRQARAKLAKESEIIRQQISRREDEHKRQNQSRCKDREFVYYAKHMDLCRHEGKSWKTPSTVAEFDAEIERQQWNDERKAKL